MSQYRIVKARFGKEEPSFEDQINEVAADGYRVAFIDFKRSAALMFADEHWTYASVPMTPREQAERVIGAIRNAPSDIPVNELTRLLDVTFPRALSDE